MICLNTSLLLYFSFNLIHDTSVKNQHDNAKNVLNAVLLTVENEYKSYLYNREIIINLHKIEIKNIVNMAYNDIEQIYNRYKNKEISEEEAIFNAKKYIKSLRYADGNGYLWLQTADREKPIMIEHPTMPLLNGEILDPVKFEKILGFKTDFFDRLLNLGVTEKQGYLKYKWPKPDDNGKNIEKEKISYIKLFSPWNWIIGTGIYIEDVDFKNAERLKEIISELKHTFENIKLAETGYMYVFNGNKDMIIHPNLVGNVSYLINPGTDRYILDDLMIAGKTPDKPFYYNWDHPDDKDNYEYRKLSYVRYFEPLDWYIVSSVYEYELENPSNKLIKNILLVSIFVLLLSLVIAIVLSNNIISPLKKLTEKAKEIKENTYLDIDINSNGPIEIKELSKVLKSMINSTKKKIKEKEKLVEKIQELLVQNEKMKNLGELLVGITHEIKNPVSGIIQSLQNIKRRISPELDKNLIVSKDLKIDLNTMNQYLENRKVMKFIRGIEKDSNRTLEIITNMLDYSREGFKEKKYEDINQKLDYILNIVFKDNELSKNKKISEINVIKKYFEKLPEILCYSQEIGQVFFNIIKNAIQVLVECDKLNPEIVLNTYYDEKNLYVEIGNNGPLIVKDMKEQIFNPFYTTKISGDGTGLGLSVAKFIIEKKHNGELKVYSENELTIFKIMLPFNDL